MNNMLTFKDFCYKLKNKDKDEIFFYFTFDS